MKILPIIGIAIGVAVVFGVLAITLQMTPENIENTNSNVEKTIQTINIGTIHRDAAKMTDRFKPMIDYVAEKLSNDQITYAGQVMVPNSQEKMIEYINNHEIDIYVDSPLIGLKINQDAKMSPVLFAWKEDAMSYHTVFIVHHNSEINSLDNLNGKTIIFEDVSSTSGYLLPLYHLEQLGYTLGNEPTPNLTYKFSEDDENTALWIVEGRGDIGALSNFDFEQIPDNAKNELKIIGQTNEIPRQLVFFRDDLEVDSELLEIFLEMNDSEIPDVMNPSKLNKFSELNTEKDLSHIKTVLESLNIE